MDDETMNGWVWCSQLYDDTHVWSDVAGKPIPKSKGGTHDS